MSVIFLIPVVLGVLLLCVAGMAVGVMKGRKPIQHCGNATVDKDGNRVDCALCGKKSCPNKD